MPNICDTQESTLITVNPKNKNICSESKWNKTEFLKGGYIEGDKFIYNNGNDIVVKDACGWPNDPEEGRAEVFTGYCRSIGDYLPGNDRFKQFEWEWVKQSGSDNENFEKKFGINLYRYPFQNDIYCGAINYYAGCTQKIKNLNYNGQHPDGICGACSISYESDGYFLRCKRVGNKSRTYLADPVVCCFNDYNCSSNENNENACFQTPERQRTCNPSNRDLGDKNCLNTIRDYCVGNTLFTSQNHWLEMWLEDSVVEVNSNQLTEAGRAIKYPTTNYDSPRWSVLSSSTTTGNPYSFNELYEGETFRERAIKYPIPMKQPCLRAMARAITKNDQICSWEELSEENLLVEGYIDTYGYNWSRSVLEEIYDKYVEEFGNLLGGINKGGYNKQSGFYNTLWKICNKFPGLCTNILKKMCSGYTENSVVRQPDAANWCGCYLNDSEYSVYEEKYGITRECSPICNRDKAIPLVDNSLIPKICRQSVCIITDNLINLVNSEVEEGLNFNQVCNPCGSSNLEKDYDSETGSSITIKAVTGIETNVNGYGLGYTNGSLVNLIPTDGGVTGTPLQGIVTVLRRKVYGLNITNGSSELFRKYLDKKEVELQIAVENVPPANIIAVAPLLFSTVSVPRKNPNPSTDFSYRKFSYGSNIETCFCVFDGNTLKSVGSKLGSINFEQNCGEETCTDPEGNRVSCSDDSFTLIESIETVAKKTAEKEIKEKYRVISLTFSIFVALFFFISTSWFFRRFYKKR